MGCLWGQCSELGAWWWGWPIPRRYSWVSREANNRGREYCGCRHCLFEQKRAVAKYQVPDCGIKLTLAQGCRTDPPGYIGWQAGTTTIPESTTVYPPVRDCKFGYGTVLKGPWINWGGHVIQREEWRNHKYRYRDIRGPEGVRKLSWLSPLGVRRVSPLGFNRVSHSHIII
jgi:hypothetical protein